MQELIPKKIHAVWYGGPVPEHIRRRFEHWRELNPAYKFMLWNESNSPMHIPYLRNALRDKNWSNASNFTRLWSLYHEGGIYMDTDVDLLRPLDELLANACFLGFEASSTGLQDVVNGAVIGSLPRHEFISSCLQALLYEFHGTEDSNLSGPALMTRICRAYGLVSYGEQCLVRGRIRIYKKEMFYPVGFDDPPDVTPEIPPSSIAVHRWYQSWCTQHRSLIERALIRCCTALLFAILHSTGRSSSVRRILDTAFRRAAQSYCLTRRTVAAGLFRGVSLNSQPNGPGCAKLLGANKCALQMILAGLVVHRYSHIYNVGCNDAHSLVCVGGLFPDAQLLAYDTDPSACRAATENLQVAGMSSRSQVHNRPFDWPDVESVGSRTLLICDIEGAEVDLFASHWHPRRLPDDIIVEVHEFIDSEAVAKLTATLCSTHKTQIIGESPPPSRMA